MALDSNYYNVGLLLNFEGSDGSTTFTDISITPKTPTVNGDAQIDTAQFRTGSSSMLLDGTGDYLSYAQHADFDFGTGDFCIEFWYRANTITTDQALVSYLVPSATVGADVGFGIHMLGATSDKIYAFFYSGATETACSSLAAIVAGTWYHIRVNRVSGIVYLWLDGVLQESKTLSYSIQTPTSRALHIGRYSNSNIRAANGWIDGLRITKGVGRGAVSFTPSTELFEASPGETGTASLTGPIGQMTAGSGASAFLSAPMGQLLIGTGGSGILSAPMGSVYGVGHPGPDNVFEGRAPMGTLQAIAGASAKVAAPSGTLLASGTSTLIGSAELDAPFQRIMASATSGAVGNASLSLSGRATLRALGGANGSMTGPRGRLSGAATSGAVANALLVAPGLILTASGTVQNFGGASLTAPMLRPVPSGAALLAAPMAFLVSEGREVIAVTYEAYAVNLQPGDRMPHQVTRYTNYPFNQIVRFQGSYFGVADDGLYLLGGDTDYHATTPVGPAWAWHTAITNFKSNQIKGTREAIVSGRLGPAVTASVSVGEKADNTYAAQIVRGATAQNHRLKYGRGLDAVYWSFGLADPAGGACEVDSMEFDVTEQRRKV
jgi:Concanavalin A-like lectin/glucanases superfamily